MTLTISSWAEMHGTIDIVARHYGLPAGELKGQSRRAPVVRARQAAMYLLWLRGGYTLAEIGAALGGRSAATVSYGFQKIAGLIRNNKKMMRSIKAIHEEMGG